MGRWVSILAIVAPAVILTGSSSRAEAPASEAERDGRQPHGLLSHGDSSGFVEDLYGDRVERAPAGDAATGARKYDPAVNWDDRRLGR